ncbi:uncharacterized protein LOC142326957 [Lycorma delicatula]|uniref:uncharacterized protein LOC142326957 n=1 Tax=Lycorma delicatula TaxID=130591 RepID=UPI003F513383
MLLYSLCSMGPVYVLLKIVLFLSSLNIKVLVRCSTTGENTTNVFNSSQGYFTKSVSHYDLVYPKKMMKNGKFLSHNVTNFFDDDIDFFKKGGMKRQIKETDELHYHVPMNNGEILKLALMPNYDIVGPSLLVEHKHADSEFNVGKSKFNTAPRKGCYYKGVVQNDPNSKVAVATCQGLAGFIKSKDGDFIIEPTSHFNSHDGSHGHIIFRKGKDFNRDDLKGSACGVKAKPGKMNKEQEEKTNDKMDNRNEGEQSEPEAIDQSQQSLPNDSSDGVEDEEPEVEEEEEGQTENIEDEEGVLVTKEIIQDTSTSASKLKKKTKVKQKVNDNAPHRSNYLKTIEMTTEFHTDINNDEDEDEDQELENSEVTTEDTSKSRNCVVKGNRTICSGSHDKNRYSDNTKIYKFHKKFKKIDLIGDDDDGQISHLHKKYVFNRNKKHKKIHRGKCLSKNIVRDEESKIYDVKDVPTNIFISTENKTTDTDGKVFDNSLFKDDKRLCSFSKKKTSSCNIMHSPKSKKYGNIKKYYPDDDDYNRINGYNYDNTDALTKDNNNLNDNDGRLYGNFNSSSKQTITDLKWFEQERGNKTTNSDNKIRRQIEYQSCNLPEKCKNKTECIWDVRITIVASYLFGQRHKDIDLETFILTIVNMVNRNFQDGSIGIMLNIKLVRMVFIEYKMPELDEDIVKLDELFENFCLFQYRINPYKSDHPNHHDVAIYIVSSDQKIAKIDQKIVESKGSLIAKSVQKHAGRAKEKLNFFYFSSSSCITNVIYGMSHQSSICNCQKSCILSFDEGLLLGNIITHQLGHSLGAEHDPKSPAESGCCGAFGRNSHCHMEPSITLNSTQWSKCSSLAIKNFIRTQGYKCLKQGTIDLDFDWAIQMLPGQIYNPVQQCSLNYHMPMLPCYTGDFCKHLYCQINDKQCISTLTPPAEGTPCAAHMWCIRGLCVNEGRYPYTINGEWNSWGQWSPCSRSCGGGVQLSSRLCNNPPPSYGGRYCIGKRIRYRMCNTDVCNQYALSFREVQCRETEEFPFRGQYYGWKAFYHNFEYIECSLLCESETGIVAVRQLVALDGTRCKPGTKNTCIAGKCMEVGCDWGINSGAITDSCGICHGNGTECKIIQGIYTERNNTGYVPFMKVPRGSGMIYARELNPSDLYIVVASYNTDCNWESSSLNSANIFGDHSNVLYEPDHSELSDSDLDLSHNDGSNEALLNESDTCSTCDAEKGDEEHTEKHHAAFEAMISDRNLAESDSKVAYLTTNLQQTMPLSHLSTSKAFYLHLAWFYNLDIHIATKECSKTILCTWPEDQANQGSSEILSSLLKTFEFDEQQKESMFSVRQTYRARNNFYAAHNCQSEQLIRRTIGKFQKAFSLLNENPTRQRSNTHKPANMKCIAYCNFFFMNNLSYETNDNNEPTAIQCERGAKKPRSGDKDYGSTRGFYSLIANMERIFIPGPTDEDLIFYVFLLICVEVICYYKGAEWKYPSGRVKILQRKLKTANNQVSLHSADVRADLNIYRLDKRITDYSNQLAASFRKDIKMKDSIKGLAKFNRDKNFGIRYQFSLPEVNPCYIPTYSWQFTEWDKCSDACGGGQQKARPRCIEDRGGVVESVYCEDLKKPDDVVRSCNEFPCLPKWWVGSWSECIWVGKEELRYRAVLCMRTRDPSSLRNEILKDRYCCEEEKPDAVRRCNETLPRCVEKPTACDINTLTDEFPNIMNFDDLKLNFVSDEMDNEKNENSNKNKVKSEDTIIDQMPKQDDKLKDTELEFDNSDDEVGYNEKPSRIKENIVNKYNSSVINISELKEDLKNKRGMPHHFKNVYPVIKKDALAAEHLRKSASLKDSPRRMGLKRLHEIEAAPRKSVVKISNSNTTYSGVSSLSNSNKVVKNQGVGGFGKSSDVHLTSPSLSTRFNILRASVNNRTSFTGTPTLVSVFSSAKLNTIFAGASGAVSAHVTCSTQDPCVRTECPISAGLKCLPASQPLHKVLDQIILNMYKIAVIPIVCEKHLHRPSDLDYQSFQETSIWSVGAEANRTILIGESALQFILNARKNMSQIPFVYHAEN